VPDGEGVVVVDGSCGKRMSGIGGWLISPSGQLECWSFRLGLSRCGDVEIDALMYGAHRAMAHNPDVVWSIYSDRKAVGEELAEATFKPIDDVMSWILSGRIIVKWVSRDSGVMQSADALARAGRFLPMQPTNINRLIKSLPETSG